MPQIVKVELKNTCACFRKLTSQSILNRGGRSPLLHIFKISDSLEHFGYIVPSSRLLITIRGLFWSNVSTLNWFTKWVFFFKISSFKICHKFKYFTYVIKFYYKPQKTGENYVFKFLLSMLDVPMLSQNLR